MTRYDDKGFDENGLRRPFDSAAKIGELSRIQHFLDQWRLGENLFVKSSSGQT